MMGRTAIATLLLALLPTWATPAAFASPAEVEASFEAYKQALIEGDGKTASELTASDTHAFLDQTLDRALTMEEAELRALPLLDQIAVLMLRHNMKPEDLREMKDGDPVAYAVDKRSFDMNEVSRLEAADFTVTGTQAQAPLANLKGSPIPVNVHFKEEGGIWRFDLLSSIAPFRALFATQAGMLGAMQTSDGKSGVVPLIIHLITGRAPDADIWNPPG